MTFLRGKLIRDARLMAGKEDASGHLHLRGETVSLHPDFAQLIDTRRTKKRRPTRADASNKQSQPDATK